jgi:hypothetical protein
LTRGLFQGVAMDSRLFYALWATNPEMAVLDTPGLTPLTLTLSDIVGL